MKFLPDVKEIFNNSFEVKNMRSRYDIYKQIDANYYRYRDDEDIILDKVKRPVEKETWAKALREW